MNKFYLWPILLFTTSLNAQDSIWDGKKAAIVITYDDAIDQHLDHAVPVLDSLGLKATFYLTAFSRSVQTRLEDWRALAVNGHELGNHTLYHPCAGGTGREWVPADYDLRNYTVTRMIDEIRMTNLFLQALDGKIERSFAYTCGDQMVQDSLFISTLKNDFIAARGVRGQLQQPASTDLYNIDCYVVNQHRAADMIGWAKAAMEKGSLLVILFHGVGGGNGLDVTLQDHREFLLFLQQNREQILTTTLLDAAKRIRHMQQQATAPSTTN